MLNEERQNVMSRLDAIKKAIDERKQKSGGLFAFIDPQKAERFGITQYKITEGDHFVRIIPPKDLAQHFAKSIYVHEKIGVDGRNFVCREKMNKGVCPICEKLKAIRSVNPEDPQIKALYAREKVCMLVVDVKNQATVEKGWQYMILPKKAYEQITALMLNKRTGNLTDISDPKTGQAVIFTRKGMGQTTTEYLGFALDTPSEIPTEWLEVPDFEDLILYREEAEIREAMALPEATTKPEMVQEETIRKPFVSTVQKPAEVAQPTQMVVQEVKTEASASSTAGDLIKSRLDAFKAKAKQG